MDKTCDKCRHIYVCKLFNGDECKKNDCEHFQLNQSELDTEVKGINLERDAKLIELEQRRIDVENEKRKVDDEIAQLRSKFKYLCLENDNILQLKRIVHQEYEERKHKLLNDN